MTNANTNVNLDGRTFAIGVLSLTACVLFVGLMLLMAQPRTARASGMIDRGGDYVMSTIRVDSNVEALLVLDSAARRVNVYVADTSHKKLTLVQNNIPLEKMPGAIVDPANKRNKQP